MQAAMDWLKKRLGERSSQIQLAVLALMGLVAFGFITLEQIEEWAGRWTSLLLLAGPFLGFAVADSKPTPEKLLEMTEKAAQADPRFARVLGAVARSAEAFAEGTGAPPSAGK